MILFRADGNKIIGSGHTMRCLSIAEAARESGLDCRFAVSDASFAETIQNRGFPCDALDTDYFLMEQELPKLRPVLMGVQPDQIIVDSYFVTAEYLRQLRAYGQVIYMDDLAAFAYPVDVLVNYNIFSLDLDYSGLYATAGVQAPQMLLGTDYAPLRKEFQGLSLKTQPRKVRNVLVSLGGADPEHIAVKLIGYLQNKAEITDHFVFHVIIGAFEPDADYIEELARSQPWLVAHRNIRHMAGLMQQCDVAISAAGSTLYELCACGIPTITYALADNQILCARAFAQRGIMLSIGDCRGRPDFPGEMCAILEKLCDDYTLRCYMALTAHRTIGGSGADCLVRALASAAERSLKQNTPGSS